MQQEQQQARRRRDVEEDERKAMPYVDDGNGDCNGDGGVDGDGDGDVEANIILDGSPASTHSDTHTLAHPHEFTCTTWNVLNVELNTRVILLADVVDSQF